MKYLYTIFLITFLASCTGTQDNLDTEIDLIPDATIKTVDDIDSEISNLEADETESKIVKIDATYTNPKLDVDMVVSYSLSEDNTIETIGISATNWDLSEYDTAAQVVIGKTLEEASETNITWSSLTNAAFKKALKK